MTKNSCLSESQIKAFVRGDSEVMTTLSMHIGPGPRKFPFEDNGDWKSLPLCVRQNIRRRCNKQFAKAFGLGGGKIGINASKIADQLKISPHKHEVQRWAQKWIIAHESGQEPSVQKRAGRKPKNRPRVKSKPCFDKHRDASPSTLSFAELLDATCGNFDEYAEWIRTFSSRYPPREWAYFLREDGRFYASMRRKIIDMKSCLITPNDAVESTCRMGSYWVNSSSLKPVLFSMLRVAERLESHVKRIEDKIIHDPELFSDLRSLISQTRLISDAVGQLSLDRLPLEWYRQSEAYQWQVSRSHSR